MAKAPVAGRVKTRLCPPFTPEDAALVAAAALADTLGAVAGCGADRHILALDGRPGPWLPPGFEIIRQVEGSLDVRLAAAWDIAGGPGVQIGMDTPQVSTELLDHSLDALLSPHVDSALGRAVDGGWWAIGLRQPSPDMFHGVPMSTPSSGARQRARLAALGLRIASLPVLRDLDDVDDALAIAAEHPTTRTAATVHALLAGAAR